LFEVGSTAGELLHIGQHASIGEMRDACRNLVEHCERKRLLGRLWYKWEDNIKIDLQKGKLWNQTPQHSN
jgi:hypothetical protein